MKAALSWLVGSCIDIIAARVPELPNAVPVSAQLLMGLGYHGVASNHTFLWTAENNVSIHNDTRMWNLACDMRLQRGRSGLNSTFGSHILMLFRLNCLWVWATMP